MTFLPVENYAKCIVLNTMQWNPLYLIKKNSRPELKKIHSNVGVCPHAA